jgi:predicted XRE-type DNA-binding protein
LYAGDAKDNAIDRTKRKRGRIPKAIGEKNARSKLNIKQVKEIRTLCAEKKLNQKEIAHIYKVTQTCISDIHNHRSWGWLI